MFLFFYPSLKKEFIIKKNYKPSIFLSVFTKKKNLFKYKILNKNVNNNFILNNNFKQSYKLKKKKFKIIFFSYFHNFNSLFKNESIFYSNLEMQNCFKVFAIKKITWSSPFMLFYNFNNFWSTCMLSIEDPGACMVGADPAGALPNFMINSNYQEVIQNIKHLNYGYRACKDQLFFITFKSIMNEGNSTNQNISHTSVKHFIKQYIIINTYRNIIINLNQNFNQIKKKNFNFDLNKQIKTKKYIKNLIKNNLNFSIFISDDCLNVFKMEKILTLNLKIKFILKILKNIVKKKISRSKFKITGLTKFKIEENLYSKIIFKIFDKVLKVFMINLKSYRKKILSIKIFFLTKNLIKKSLNKPETISIQLINSYLRFLSLKKNQPNKCIEFSKLRSILNASSNSIYREPPSPAPLMNFSQKIFVPAWSLPTMQAMEYQRLRYLSWVPAWSVPTMQAKPSRGDFLKFAIINNLKKLNYVINTNQKMIIKWFRVTESKFYKINTFIAYSDLQAGPALEDQFFLYSTPITQKAILNFKWLKKNIISTKLETFFIRLEKTLFLERFFKKHNKTINLNLEIVLKKQLWQVIKKKHNNKPVLWICNKYWFEIFFRNIFFKKKIFENKKEYFFICYKTKKRFFFKNLLFKRRSLKMSKCIFKKKKKSISNQNLIRTNICL